MLNRLRLQWALILVLVAGIGLWLTLGQNRQQPTLEAGLQAVEIDDGPRIQQIKEALNRAGRPDEAIVLQCAWLARHGRHADVLRHLPERLIDGPLRREALRLYGESLYRTGDLVRAEEMLKLATVEFPNDVESYRNLALLYYGVGMNELAMHEQAQIRRLAPADYRPNFLSGLVRRDAEDFEQASHEFRQALDRQPPAQVSESIRFDLARCLVQCGEYRDAVTVLERDRASNSGSVLLAECHWHLGDKVQSKEILKEVLSVEPANILALRLKAWFLEDLERIDESVALLQRVVAASPEDLESYQRLVRLLKTLGMTAESEQVRQELSRFQTLKNRLIELTAIARTDLNAVEPRQELAGICRELGRVEQVAIWQRSAEFCKNRNARTEASKR
ncbi:MAG: tetratricopeptide repeat protein [Planctomycetes bacterium]|nr:tetratricopeptide repeat protein [Planctomycetota bacterium]